MNLELTTIALKQFRRMSPSLEGFYAHKPHCQARGDLDDRAVHLIEELENGPKGALFCDVPYIELVDIAHEYLCTPKPNERITLFVTATDVVQHAPLDAVQLVRVATHALQGAFSESRVVVKYIGLAREGTGSVTVAADMPITPGRGELAMDVVRAAWTARVADFG